MGTYTVFDHTADVGLDVQGRSLEDLLETAAWATFDQMLEDRPDKVEVLDEVRAAAMPGLAGDTAELLVVWLQELLFRFETGRLVPMTFEFGRIGPGEVRATVGFGRFEPGRHRTRLEIKAVTYHGLDVHAEPDGTWRARFILDE